MSVETEFETFLYDIESSIMAIFNEHEGLMDKQVLMSIETLYRYYERLKKTKKGFAPELPGLSGKIYKSTYIICEKWLGDGLTVTEVVRCLKRIHKSIKRWSKVGGPQGYLEYISNFIAA